MPRTTAGSVTRNTVALSLAQITGVAFTMAFTIYAARVLHVEGFGKYALVKGYFDLLLSLTGTGLTIMLTREIAKRADWAPRYLSTALALVVILVMVSGAILVGIGNLFHYASDTMVALYLVSIALLPAAVANLGEATFIAFEHAQYVTYGNILENLIRTVLGVAALYAGLALESLFVILILSRVVMVCFYLVVMHRRVQKLQWHFEWPFFKQLVRDWRIFAAENWLSTLFLSLGIIILSFFFGEGAVGPYAAADRTLSPMGLFAGSYTNAVFPHLSRSWGESQEHFHRIARQSIKYMLVLVLPAAILVGVFADFVIRLLYTNAYAASVPILQILIWVLVMRFTNPFLSFTLFARGEQKKSLMVASITFVAYLSLSLWMIPLWGAVGAALSLTLAMFVAFCLYVIFVFRTGYAEILSDLGRIIPAAVVMGLFAIALRGLNLEVPIQLAVTTILSTAVYVLLILALHVPSAADLRTARRLTEHVWQRFNVRLGRVSE